MVGRGEVLHYEDMDNAQHSARSAEIKIWVDYQAKRDELEASQPARSYGGGDEGGEGGAEGGFDSAARVEGKTVTLSDMRDGSNFHVHVVEDGVCADLNVVGEQMKALGASIDDGSFVAESAAAVPVAASSSDAGEEEASPEAEVAAEAAPSAATAVLKKGSYVAAPFDGAWYRAKVLRLNDAGDRAEVQFVDYGNIDAVDCAQLHLLPKSHTKLAPQAIACTLAFVQVPTVDKPYGNEAARMLNRLLWGKTLVAKMHGRDEEGRTSVEVAESAEAASVNEQMVRAGLARVPAPRRGRGGFGGRGGGKPARGGPSAALQAAQAHAAKNHLNIFRYGVALGDDDDDCKEFGMPEKRRV